MDSGVVGWLALWGAIAASGVSCAAALRGRASVAWRAGLAAASLAWLSVVALCFSLLSGNFALAYVADTTTRQGSWAYRLAGLWGGNGGSLLLWSALVLGAGVVATRSRPSARLAAAATGGALLLVDAVAANPFARLAIPAIDGGGLTPILRYPAMLYHPLLLYGGHAALVGPFALAMAGLASGRLDQSWRATTRTWMLAAWLLLGLALLAGAHWAYVELGWGGFWAWDPVENSGLLPWLAATAFLHRAGATVNGDSGRVGLAGLAALPFALSLVGATVSRSGAAQSVHGFAEAAAVGRGLLALVVASLAVLVALVIRANRRLRAAQTRPPTPQDGALAAAVVVLLAMALVILVGTVFPVLAQGLASETVEVTTRYYAIVVTPLAVVAIVLMGAGPGLGRPAGIARWLMAAGLAAAGAAVLARSGHLVAAVLGAAAVLAGALAVAELISGGRSRGLRRAAALVAHLGMAVLILGVAGSLLGQRAANLVQTGQRVSLGGFTIRYRDLMADQRPGWRRVSLTLDVSRDGHPVAVLHPALRVLDGQSAALSDVALRSTPAQDLVVTVSHIDPATSAVVLQVTVRPLVTLVWWGGLLAAGGGILVWLTAMRGRRHGNRESAPLTPEYLGVSA